VTAIWGTLPSPRPCRTYGRSGLPCSADIPGVGIDRCGSIDGVARLRLIGDFLVTCAVNPFTDRVENYVYGTVCASTSSTRKSRSPPPARLLGPRDGTSIGIRNDSMRAPVTAPRRHVVMTRPIERDSVDTPRLIGARYRLGDVIGRSLMSEVRRGEDLRLKRTVAIKLLRADGDPRSVARFEREAQILARLHHPNIVVVFDTGVDGEDRFIVMEFIEGPTLRELLDNDGPLSLERAERRISRANWPRRSGWLTTEGSFIETSNRRMSCSLTTAGQNSWTWGLRDSVLRRRSP
jgi:hypothetical protein